MRRIKFLPTVLLLMLITACAAIGLAPPESFDAKLAYAYKTHTSLLLSIPPAVDSGLITKADGRHVIVFADQSRVMLDEAKILKDVDVNTADGKLTLASDILKDATKYIDSRKTPVKTQEPP